MLSLFFPPTIPKAQSKEKEYLEVVPNGTLTHALCMCGGECGGIFKIKNENEGGKSSKLNIFLNAKGLAREMRKAGKLSLGALPGALRGSHLFRLLPLTSISETVSLSVIFSLRV